MNASPVDTQQSKPKRVMPYCVKTAFKDPETANYYAKKQRNDRRPRVHKREPYFCDKCSAWHLKVVK